MDPSAFVSDSWEGELANAPSEHPATGDQGHSETDSTVDSSDSAVTNRELSTEEIVQLRHYHQRSRHPPDRYVEQCV